MKKTISTNVSDTSIPGRNSIDDTNGVLSNAFKTQGCMKYIAKLADASNFKAGMDLVS